MKTLNILIILTLITSCAMPEYPEVVTTPTPPTTPSPEPTPAPEPTPEAPAANIPEPAPIEEETPDPVTPKDEMSLYVSAFESRNLVAGGLPNPSHLKIDIVTDLPNNVLGTCSMNMAYVRINQFYWDQLSAEHKEELIFHELGHCVLGRYHNDAKDGSGIPISIMNSYHMGPGVYLRSASAYRSYMAELFGTNYATFSTLNYNGSAYASQAYAFASLYRGNGESDYSMDGMEEVTCTKH